MWLRWRRLGGARQNAALADIDLGQHVTHPPPLPTGVIRADPQVTGRRIAATLLGQILGFRSCAPEAIDDLAAAGRTVALDKGEVLVRRGEPFDRLGLVIEGSLEVSVSRHNGRRVLLAYLQPGDVAGMMSLWDGMPHPSDLLAREKGTRVLVVPGAAWRELHQRHLSLGLALEVQMAYRSRLLHERLIVDSTMSLDVRLARQLHLLSALGGRTRAEGERPVLRLSQADLGDVLGVSRPHANAAVQQLRREGLIELHYATVTIVDPQGLAQRAGL